MYCNTAQCFLFLQSCLIFLTLKRFIMSNFKVGDIVILKSGGPKMTVETIQDEEFIVCIWFNEKQETHQKKFHQDLLKKYTPPDISKSIIL